MRHAIAQVVSIVCLGLVVLLMIANPALLAPVVLVALVLFSLATWRRRGKGLGSLLRRRLDADRRFPTLSTVVTLAGLFLLVLFELIFDYQNRPLPSPPTGLDPFPTISVRFLASGHLLEDRESPEWELAEEILISESALQFMQEAIQGQRRSLHPPVPVDDLVAGLELSMIDDGFFSAGEVDGTVTYQRTVVMPAVINDSAFRTQHLLDIALPDISISSLPAFFNLKPDTQSQLVLEAPKYFIARTSPPALSREEVLDGDERLTFSLASDTAVRYEAIGGIWRLPLLRQVKSFSFSGFAYAILAIVSGVVTSLLTDTFKAGARVAGSFLSRTARSKMPRRRKRTLPSDTPTTGERTERQ